MTNEEKKLMKLVKSLSTKDRISITMYAKSEPTAGITEEAYNEVCKDAIIYLIDRYDLLLINNVMCSIINKNIEMLYRWTRPLMHPMPIGETIKGATIYLDYGVFQCYYEFLQHGLKVPEYIVEEFKKNLEKRIDEFKADCNNHGYSATVILEIRRKNKRYPYYNMLTDKREYDMSIII